MIYENELFRRLGLATVAAPLRRGLVWRFRRWSSGHGATGRRAAWLPARWAAIAGGFLEPHRGFIIERINQTPHLTLHRLKDELAARGVKVSHNAVLAVPAPRGFELQKKRCSPLSRVGRTLPASESVGNHGSTASIRAILCSLTRPGSKPTWRPFAAGGQKESDYADLRHTGAGAP